MRVEIIEDLIAEIITDMRKVDKDYKTLTDTEEWIKGSEDWTNYSKTFHTSNVKNRLEIYGEILKRIKVLKTRYEVD